MIELPKHRFTRQKLVEHIERWATPLSRFAISPLVFISTPCFAGFTDLASRTCNRGHGRSKPRIFVSPRTVKSHLKTCGPTGLSCIPRCGRFVGLRQLSDVVGPKKPQFAEPGEQALTLGRIALWRPATCPTAKTSDRTERALPS